MAAKVLGLAVWVIPVLLAITFHEAAHGYAAYVLGDDTAKRAGRLSLNPKNHIDPVGTILMPLALYFSPDSYSAMPSRCRCASTGCAARAAT